jgi:endoglucanase
MEDITPFLKQLISLPGLSGFESPVRNVITERWAPLVDELSVSKVGSLHGLKHAAKEKADGSLLLAAHMDAVGLMISGFAESFLRVTPIGGIDPRILPGQPVIVHGRRELPGIAILLPDQLLKNGQSNPAPAMKHILVDTGLTEKELKELVEIGAPVSFATPPVEMAGDVICGHSLDNRASLAAVTICLEELRGKELQWDVWAAATVQEEETLAGASTSAFALKPDLAIAIDVTFGSGPDDHDYRCFPLGKGITIGIGANVHPYMQRRLEEISTEVKIPYEMEVMPVSSGTDAIALQVTESGIPCEVIGIPLKNMHTPVEMVAMADIINAGNLLAAFIERLDGDFLPSLQKEMLG